MRLNKSNVATLALGTSPITGRMRPDTWLGDVEDWFSGWTRRISFYSTHSK